ncbi:nucleoporin Nup124 [Schizosaccharomyces osmophilus]|uniref:Nucleoporin Nup124 n=1 Tax=Schizosaccharomyces osmophilus TaxID=2545709 RepID=A0AAE9WBQ8_9SCHI|nr:nucleoporin Nup124 [Schizosaccharomyces osmophilus]WBW71723.1 nucleoporin Nup124 [Schizosaccharomyces osmophilus]
MPPSSRNQRANKKVQRTPYERHESGNHRPYFSVLKATFASILRPFTSSWSNNAETETSNNKRASRSLLDPELNPHYLGRTPHIVRINNRSHIRTLDGIEGRSNESDLSSKQNTQDSVENQFSSRRGSVQLDLQPLKQRQFASERRLQPPPLTSSSAALLDILRSIRTNTGVGNSPRAFASSQSSTGQRNENNVPSQRNGHRSSSKRDRPQSPGSEITKFDATRTDDKVVPSYSSDEHTSSDQKLHQPNGASRTEPKPKRTKREELETKTVTSSLKEVRKEKLRQELIPLVYETLERIDLKKQKQVNAEVQTEEQPGNLNSVNKQDFVSQYEYSFPSGGNKKRVRAAFSALDEDLDELFDKDEDSTVSNTTSRSTAKHNESLVSGPDKKPPKILLPHLGPTFEQLQSSLSPKRTQPGTQESAIALPTDIPNTSEKETKTPKTADSTTETPFKPAEPQPINTLKSLAALPDKDDTVKPPESSSGKIPKFEFKPVTKNTEVEDKEGQNKTAVFSFGESSDNVNKTFGQTTFTTEKPSAPKKPFAFGPVEKDPTKETAEAPNLSFNFKPTSTNKNEQAPAPSFSFGQISEEKEPKESKKPSFSFGLPSQQQPPKPTTPSFTFGETADNKPSDTSFKPPFSFGQLAPNKKLDEQNDKVADSTRTDKKDPNVPKLSFSFGQQSEKKEPSDSKPAFSFGQTATAATSQSPSSVFSFGKPSTDQKSTGSISGPFANAAPPMKTETPKFTFGQTTERNDAGSNIAEDKSEQTPKPAFSFGQSLKDEEKNKKAKPSFSFGQSLSKDESKESTVPSSDTNAAKPAFTFGQPTGLATSAATKPAFSFGGPQKKDEATGNEQPSTSIFSFSKPSEVGMKDNTDPVNKSSAEVKPTTSVFSFGSNTTSNAFNPAEKPTPFFTGITGNTSSTLTPNKENRGPFGKTEPNEQEKAKPFNNTSTEKPFLFSKTTESEKQKAAQPTTPFTFGSTADPPATAFGSTPSNTAINGIAQNSAFPINSSSSAPGFGTPSTANTQPPKTSDASAPSGFGSGFSQPGSQPAGGFGSSAFGNNSLPFSSKPKADSDGLKNTTAFGSTTQPPSAGFTFGASGNTTPSAFGAANPSGFNTNIGSTEPSLNFGTSQPPNPPNAGFSFGGSGTPAFSAGSSAAQSPAPQPQGGIQFNLGSTNEQPNPPTGRKIAVPRSRRKR